MCKMNGRISKTITRDTRYEDKREISTIKAIIVLMYYPLEQKPLVTFLAYVWMYGCMDVWMCVCVYV